MVEVPRLLYIDNDTHMAADRAETLSSAYELTVHTASDVSTAKAVLTSHDIDCVVSEFRLGEDDGFDLLSHVRAEYSSLPVVLLIDDEPDGVARDAFNSGATDLFPRSMLELSYDPLVDRIHELTDAATPRATSDATTTETADDTTTPETADDTTTPETVDSPTEPTVSAAPDSEPEPTPATTSTAETATSTDGGGTEAITGGSSTAADTTNGTPEESTTAAGGGTADSLSGLNLAELRELPKEELIALLAEVIGDDDEPATESAERMAETIDTAEPTDDKTAQPTPETADSSTPPTTDEPEPSVANAQAGDGTPSPDAVTPDTAMPDSDETAWETAEGYRRPPGLDPTPGSTILVQCSSQDDRKHDARRDLLGVTEVSDRNVLLIQYRAMNTDRLAAIAEAAQRVKVITVGCSQTVPNTVTDTVEVVNINNPNDVTRLGILSTKTLDDWQPLDGEVAVSLDPLDVLFRYKSVEGTFRFLHIFLGKLSAGGAVSSFFVNPSASNPQDVNTLKPLFDHILNVDDAGVDLEGS
ncbi:MAG: response regulator containing CheY-like receiver, AAA-type ATPase, and DNA-binding domain protein [Halonotius sp. J07HN4]|nr:MAG: response regulator containing CheY-like receiver, AAA-type ATPase, and DNA-binding domain protein [Halonotius sp. J07HN4]